MKTKLSKAAIMAWRRHLDSEHGRTGLSWLREQRPRISRDPCPHLFGMAAGIPEGYDIFFDKLEELQVGETEHDESDDGRARLE